METITTTFGVLSILIVMISFVMLIINLIRKKNLEIWGVLAGGGLVLFVVMVILSPDSNSPESSAASPPDPSTEVRSNDSTTPTLQAPVRKILPTEAKAPTRTPMPAPTPTPTFEQLKGLSVSIEYDDLFRNNERHIGKLVYYRGKVTEVNHEGGNKYRLRVNVTEERDGVWDDDVGLDYEGSRLLEDDVIEFLARVQGLWTYTAVLGNERTIPSLLSLELRLAQEFDPSTVIFTPAPTPMSEVPAVPSKGGTPAPEPTLTLEPLNLSGAGQQASSSLL